MQQPIHLPDFIPDDLQQAHGAEARCRVAEARRRPVQQPAPRSGPHTARTDLVAALLVALPGTILLSVLWAWLAITTSDLIWWAPTVGGATVAAVLALAVWLAKPTTSSSSHTPSHPGVRSVTKIG